MLETNVKVSKMLKWLFGSKKKLFSGHYWNLEYKLIGFEIEAKSLGDAVLKLRKSKDFWAMCRIYEVL